MTIDFQFELRMRKRHGFDHIAGLDEVGRGPLAGPVTAGAFLFLEPVAKRRLRLLRDSKLLNEPQRETMYELFCKLREEGKVEFATYSAFPKTVDKQRIHRASVMAMRKAVKKLSHRPDIVVIDKFPYPERILNGVKYKALHKADDFVPSCAAASIVAKVRRDRTMHNYHNTHPEYRFDLHKGYGTKLHYQMLKKNGPSPVHRKSFRLK